jgi:hypothetical protein
MPNRDLTESGRDRAALARGAGFGRISFISVLAGVLVAYGGFAVLLAAASGIAQATGVADTLSFDDLSRLGLASGAVIVAAMLVSYLFGGYVTGRMARRAGLLNGLSLFVLAVLLVAVLGALVTVREGSDQVTAGLRDAGIPTTIDGWGQIYSLTGIGSLLAMLVGALLGSMLGERWHSKLTRRAAKALVEREVTAARDAKPPEEPADRFRTERARDALAVRSASSGGSAAPATGGGVATAERPAGHEAAGAGGRHLRNRDAAGGEDVTVEQPGPGDRKREGR